MVVLWILLGLLGFICLLLSSPVSLHFIARGETPRLTLRVWGIPIRLLPQKPRSPQPKKSAAASAKPAAKEKKKPAILQTLQTTFEEDGLAATLQWLGEMASLAKRSVGRLLRAVRVPLLRLSLRIPGEDMAAVAIRYGEICAAVYPMLAVLSKVFRIRQREVDLVPDFTFDGGAAAVEIRACLSLWRLAGAAICLIWDLGKLYFLTDDTKQVTKERTV